MNIYYYKKLTMKIKTLLIASIIFTGCTSYHHSKCSAYANCDEFYPYSCEDSVKFVAYTPREYKKYARRNWDYTGYYPNTQTVYYYDFYGNRLQPNEYRSRDINGRPTVGDVTRPNAPNVTRPTNLGDWGGDKPQRSSREQRN